MARSPMRWKWGEPSRFISSPRTCELRRSGEVLAIAQQTAGGWFWYTMANGLPPINTAGNPPLSLNAAKAEAQAYVRAALPPAGGR